MSDTPWTEPDFGAISEGAEVQAEEAPAAEAEEAKPEKKSSRKAPARKAAPARRKAPGAQVDRKVVERILDKRVEIETSSDETRVLASKLLGVPDEVDALTIACLSGGLDEKTVAKLVEVREADQGEASILVFSMGNAKKALWDLIATIGGKSGNLPSSEIKAAVAIADAAKALDGDALDNIDSVRELIG